MLGEEGNIMQKSTSYQKTQKITRIDQDVETLEPSFIAGANVKLLWRPVC